MATVAIDFDGVIHSYSRGYADGSIYDPPAPGAIDALNDLLRVYAVYVHTTREAAEVALWLRDQGGFITATDTTCRTCAGWIPEPGDAVCTECGGDGRMRFWDEPGIILVSALKLPAIAYVDDRAVAHRGDWNATLAAVAELDPRSTRGGRRV